ncbi:germ cell nuclear acidic protein isoform X2 [Linepithema humile]|uniref:germ cell nuclear acidic protein isoform X2 n=1 Tax=Linepithema humile TaxID=83485 RepID=UPI0006231B9B|nr:PREDICTED: uncharacterized protein LOC105667345 isoform X2 [Linepithema humile]
MLSNYNTREFVANSQNFTLRLSEDSTVEDTYDFVTIRKTKNKDDIIVISDSSCSSSPKHIDTSQSKSTSVSNVNKKKGEFTRQNYQRLHLLDTSSESEEEKPNSSWRRLVKSDNKSSDKKYSDKINKINKSVIQIEKAFCTSDDTTSSSDGNSNHIIKDGISNLKKSYATPLATLIFPERKLINQKVREKYDIKETNKVVTPSRAKYNYNFDTCNRENKLIFNTPDKDDTGKIKLTKQDTQKILRNIKATRIIYDSPRQKKETNVIIDESTDIDDIMHPAMSPRNNKNLKNSVEPSQSPDVINISLKNDIIPNSQVDLSKRTKTCFREFSNTPKKEDLYRPLSEKKKIQIAEWLMTNSADSRNDSSYSHVSRSNTNSINSGNSSLERLEMKYETPNNRGKFNKMQTDEKTIILNSDDSDKDSLTHQTALNTLVPKSKNNINSEFCTPDRLKILPKIHTDKKISPVNTSNKDVIDCADILDKLYGKSWRDKANALIPTSEPRKTSVHTANRIVQTERKPVIRKKHYVADSDSDESDLEENNIKPNQGRKIQQKYKKRDSFINDESLSGSDIESEYHTALTNPRTSVNSTATKPVSVPASIKRLQTICDTDTEDENDKSTTSSKSLLRKKLSFSDDESSDTSEYDPGDYVPPKNIYKKKATTKIPQLLKVTSKIESTITNNNKQKTSKFVEYQSFLKSLSNAVPMSSTHPNAKKYRLHYKHNKEELCKELYKLYNEKVFDNKLPRDMPIEWNVRMRGTAGYCYNKKTTKSLSGVARSSRIVLATKILDTPDRLRDTLIHEMCHAAAWLINNVSDGHGAFWTAWVSKAMKAFPELPPIRRCHDYDIKTKFTYRCTSCGYSIGRHSKSLDIEKKRCGYCYGKFELLINKTTKSGTVQVQTPQKKPSGFALFVKQNYNSVKKEKNSRKHADVMKILGIRT